MAQQMQPLRPCVDTGDGRVHAARRHVELAGQLVVIVPGEEAPDLQLLERQLVEPILRKCDGLACPVAARVTFRLTFEVQALG